MSDVEKETRKKHIKNQDWKRKKSVELFNWLS